MFVSIYLNLIRSVTTCSIINIRNLNSDLIIKHHSVDIFFWFAIGPILTYFMTFCGDTKVFFCPTPLFTNLIRHWWNRISSYRFQILNLLTMFSTYTIIKWYSLAGISIFFSFHLGFVSLCIMSLVLSSIGWDHLDFIWSLESRIKFCLIGWMNRCLKSCLN